MEGSFSPWTPPGLTLTENEKHQQHLYLGIIHPPLRASLPRRPFWGSSYFVPKNACVGGYPRARWLEEIGRRYPSSPGFFSEGVGMSVHRLRAVRYSGFHHKYRISSNNIVVAQGVVASHGLGSCLP